MMCRFALVVCVSVGGMPRAEAQIAVPTVSIGDPGNAADPFTGGVHGSVGYTYDIGAFEVTNAQYAAFLNAVAATDTHGLYDAGMSDSFGGITRSGDAGGYTYATIGGREQHPVNYVSFWDACRFANWLHNGQPSGAQSAGTTEDGAYTLTPGGISGNTITRNGGWRWAVTSEDEWYKAAYHQIAGEGGDSDDFWFYPTSSDTISTSEANFFGNDISDAVRVGSYEANASGTFDMGGNVWEWNEAIILGTERGVRGGAFGFLVGTLRSDARGFDRPTDQDRFTGFRVSRATAAPDCVADYNGSPDSGDILDFLDFIQDFSDCTNLGAPCGEFGDADVNGDTLVDILDFLDFIEAFSEGC